jgi:hypothetical protein
MKESVITVNFDVESEAYGMFAMRPETSSRGKMWY